VAVVSVLGDDVVQYVLLPLVRLELFVARLRAKGLLQLAQALVELHVRARVLLGDALQTVVPERLARVSEVVALALTGASKLATLPRAGQVAGLARVLLHAVLAGGVGGTAGDFDVGVGPSGSGERVDQAVAGDAGVELDVGLDVDVAAVGAALELPDGVALAVVAWKSRRGISGDAIDRDAEARGLLRRHTTLAAGAVAEVAVVEVAGNTSPPLPLAVL